MPDAAGAPRFTFVDLFAGIGGLRAGFEAAGGRCVATVEIDPYARRTYAANFDCSHHPFFEDVARVPANALPEHDVLLAGFPCQPFSIAGQQPGFEDRTRGTLFFHIARILAKRRPKAFLLENVKNLRGHDGGRTLATIRAALEDDLGYKVSMRVLDADHAVPQHRKRIFIAGFRDGDPLEILDMGALTTRRPRLREILHPEDGSEIPDPRSIDDEGRPLARYTLTDTLWEWHRNHAAKHRARGSNFGYGLVGPDDVARTLTATYFKAGAEILVRQEGRNPRRLTPRECARLMGFEWFGGPRFVIPAQVSNLQAYKQLGNAVVPQVAAEIAIQMARRL